MGEKQRKGNSYRKNIKGELKCRSLKFTPVFSLCSRYELYPLKQVSVLDVTPACARIKPDVHWTQDKTMKSNFQGNSVWFEPEMRLKMTFNIWQETFCGNFRSKFLARGGIRGNLASYKHV